MLVVWCDCMLRGPRAKRTKTENAEKRNAQLKYDETAQQFHESNLPCGI